MKNLFANNKIIFLIVFVSAILRLLFPTQIPFTHDEFSALFRTEFNNFHELIQFGVKPDGHPALVQVFLYYWVKLFGFSELAIKLPFILFGIASVYIIYIIALKWYNQTVGLITASLLATLQYPVMYSQIARPYISGLFFSLMMVWFWTNLIQKPQFKFRQNAAGYVIFSTLCAYNHHFSLLFAFITGITGLLVFKKKHVRKYLILGLLICLLYIPHFGIFYSQMQSGSVEDWLGKPDFYFLIDYVCYVFHYSLYTGILLIGIIIFGLMKKSENIKSKKIHFLISICWFTIPIIIGFLYSYLVGAVLQFSVLIFSFPFLLLLLFGHLPQLNFKFNILLVSLILSINILSLVFERQHYNLFYHSPYEQILIETQNVKKEYVNNCISIISSHKKISSYYLKKNTLDSNFILLEKYQKPIDFIQYLKRQTADYLSFGCLSNVDPIAINLINEYFPNLVKKIDYAGGNFYLFSKHSKTGKSLIVNKSINDFEAQISDWGSNKNNCLIDTVKHAGNYSCLINEYQEFSPTFVGNLNRFICDKNDFIDISVYIYSGSKLNNVYIASSLELKGRQIDWRATDISDFYLQDSSISWQKAYHSIKLSDISLPNQQINLKIYIWNKGKEVFHIDDFEIKVRTGNPSIYGLTKKTNKLI